VKSLIKSTLRQCDVSQQRRLYAHENCCWIATSIVEILKKYWKLSTSRRYTHTCFIINNENVYIIEGATSHGTQNNNANVSTTENGI
jgi:hypothetical protein